MKEPLRPPCAASDLWPYALLFPSVILGFVVGVGCQRQDGKHESAISDSLALRRVSQVLGHSPTVACLTPMLMSEGGDTGALIEMLDVRFAGDTVLVGSQALVAVTPSGSVKTVIPYTSKTAISDTGHYSPIIVNRGGVNALLARGWTPHELGVGPVDSAVAVAIARRTLEGGIPTVFPLQPDCVAFVTGGVIVRLKPDLPRGVVGHSSGGLVAVMRSGAAAVIPWK